MELESEVEVGDGFIGVRIKVYEMDGNTVGTHIGEVVPEPFVDSQVPRSEVATLARLTGDVVFIFDGSQAGGLMASAGSDGFLEASGSSGSVYVFHSHLVWAGWCAMMGGMALVTWAGVGGSEKRSTGKPVGKPEEE